MIQQAINQALGTAGIAARLAPGYEQRQELHQLGKEEKVLQQQSAAASLKGQDVKDPDLIRNIGDIKKREMELAKRKFQLAPTEENFQQSVKQQQAYRRFNTYEELMMRQKESLAKADGIIEAKKEQKRNFMSYLQKQPIAGGGTVGELPIQVQKQIASQYSKTQRKKLMDTMDMESKK